MRNSLRLLLLPIVILGLLTNHKALSEEGFEYRTVVSGLHVPWEILWGPDNHLWFTERNGYINRVNTESGAKQVLLKISDVLSDPETSSERGLMGLVLHPDFENNPFVYTVYNYGTSNDTRIRIARYEYKNEVLINPFILKDEIKGAWNHDGSRLWIDPDDLTLYCTIGDAAVPDYAQDTSNINGSTIRMNLDGSVPNDNPFPNNYIWTYGHRNQQGLVVHNGIMYSSEHGPNTDDELNILEKGMNYGWPLINGYCDKPQEQELCSQYGYVPALHSMTPSSTYAVAGIDYYNSDLIPELKNSILITALKRQMLVQVKLDESGKNKEYEKIWFEKEFGRLRDICISPDGKIYLATSNRDNRISGQFPLAEDDRIIEIIPVKSAVKDRGTRGNLFDINPNPANEMITFNFHKISGNSNLRIFNFIGEEIMSIETSNLPIFNWNLSDNIGNLLPDGFYLAEYISDNEATTLPVIIRK